MFPALIISYSQRALEAKQRNYTEGAYLSSNYPVLSGEGTFEDGTWITLKREKGVES